MDFTRRKQTATFDFKHIPIKKGLLFYEIWDFDSMKKNLQEMKKGDSRFKIKKAHTYIEKIDQVKIPDDIVSTFRHNSQTEIKDLILEYTGHKAPKAGFGKIDSWNLEDHIIYASQNLNVYRYGETAVEPFDVKKYLLFS